MLFRSLKSTKTVDSSPLRQNIRIALKINHLRINLHKQPETNSKTDFELNQLTGNTNQKQEFSSYANIMNKSGPLLGISPSSIKRSILSKHGSPINLDDDASSPVLKKFGSTKVLSVRSYLN